MKFLSRGAVAAAAMLIVGSFAIAYGSTTRAVSRSKPTHGSGGKLSVAMQGPIQSFNPWVTPSGGNDTIIPFDAVYDTLLRQQTDGTVIPGLVTSWKQIGRHTIKMVLRTGVKFSNGKPLTAHSVKANFDYAESVKDPGTCNSYLAGVSTKVKNRTHFTLHLKTPNPDLLKEIAECAGYVVNPQALKNPSSLDAAPDGTGPYTYEQSQTVPNQKWVFVKRRGYWDASLYPFSKLEMNFISNSTAADNAARTGQINYLFIVQPGDTSSGLKLYYTNPTQLRGFAIADLNGATVKPLGSQLVRQAMNYAINRPAILSGLYHNDGVVSGCSCSWNKTMPGYSKALNSYYTYDPAKAKALLAQAGYSNGFSFTVMDSPSDPNQALLQAISGYLAKVGITMTVTPNQTTFIPTMLSGKQPAFFENWTVTGFPYFNASGTAGPEAFWNPLHIVNPTFTADLKRDQDAITPKQVDAAYAKTGRDFARAAWYISPVLLDNVSAYNPKDMSFGMTAGAPSPYLYNFQAPKK